MFRLTLRLALLVSGHLVSSKKSGGSTYFICSGVQHCTLFTISMHVACSESTTLAFKLHKSG